MSDPAPSETLLERSARVIDSGDGPPEWLNPMGLELHELADGVAMVDGFSHVVAFDTGDGLVTFDTSLGVLTPKAIEALRSWSSAPFRTLVYTHGHADHVGGAGYFLKDAADRGDRRPDVVGHRNVAPRFDRYELTAGYNLHINARQFGGSTVGASAGIEGRDRLPNYVRPSVVYDERLDLRVGEVTFELRHGKGETDDHTWAWVPSHRAAVIGDFLIWLFPNAGNPQKVQRYPREWARVLRDIAVHEPELLLPAHGLPVQGAARVREILGTTAAVLEHLVVEVLEAMNAGATLDEIVHTVRVPDDLAARPWLQPLYDEPEFVVHNIWRLYGGWYDGNPARLKPPSDAALAAEVAVLAGGTDVLVERALAVSDAGDHRLACQLVEWAAQAAPDDRSVHEARAEVYRRRRRLETSLMAKGIYGDASRRSDAVVSPPGS